MFTYFLLQHLELQPQGPRHVQKTSTVQSPMGSHILLRDHIYYLDFQYTRLHILLRDRVYYLDFQYTRSRIFKMTKKLNTQFEGQVSGKLVLLWFSLGQLGEMLVLHFQFSSSQSSKMNIQNFDCLRDRVYIYAITYIGNLDNIRDHLGVYAILQATGLYYVLCTMYYVLSTKY